MALFFLGVSLFFCVGIVEVQGGFVQIDSYFGPVIGETTPLANCFRGLPLSKPPVGLLRWQPSEFPDRWFTPLNVSGDFKPGCPQVCDEPPFVCPKNISEDCLYVNVYTPSHPSSSKLPIMLFWSGGNYKQLSGGELLYEGDYYANFTNTVVVVANYRLGILGYGMTEEVLKGDYGVGDQILAMQWVQLNAKFFGGDPEQVTIFGQSAGASSIAVHLTSPNSTGLFQRAVMQSNPFSIEYKNVTETQHIGKIFLEKLGCDDRAGCVYLKTWEEVLQAQIETQHAVIPYPRPFQAAYLWSPTLGGKYISEQPLQSIVSGNFARVPVILGTLEEEGIQFVYQLFPKPVPKDEFDLFLPAIFGDLNAPSIERMYPVPENQTNDCRQTLSPIVTHYTFTCSARYVARALAMYVPTYLYTYDHPLSFYQAWGANFSYCYNRVCHGSELPILWHTAPLVGYTPTADEVTLGNRMLYFWGAFAHGATGTLPSYDSQSPSWPNYEAVNDISLSLNTPNNTLQVGRNGAQCDMWDVVGYLKY